MYNILLFIYVLVCIALIGFILVQQGKGANAGASFGGGASGTMFGSAGAGNFLTRTSAILATGFLISTLTAVTYKKVHLTIYLKLLNKFNNSNNKLLQQLKTKITIFRNKE